MSDIMNRSCLGRKSKCMLFSKGKDDNFLETKNHMSGHAFRLPSLYSLLEVIHRCVWITFPVMFISTQLR
jgi:hypothetical protein